MFEMITGMIEASVIGFFVLVIGVTIYRLGSGLYEFAKQVKEILT